MFNVIMAGAWAGIGVWTVMSDAPISDIQYILAVALIVLHHIDKAVRELL